MNFIIDVTDESFEEKVLLSSEEKLVVVDFWASWCAPCRSLKPILEGLAQKYNGAFLLCKIDTQVNIKIAQKYHIQGIPDVKFFFNREVVDHFTGLRDAKSIESILNHYVKDPLTICLENIASSACPLEKFEEYFSEFKKDYRFSLAYAKELIQQGKYQKAKEILSIIDSLDPYYGEAQNLIFLIQLKEECKSIPQNDFDRLYQEATKKILNLQYREAMDLLLRILEKNKSYRDEIAKKAMIYVLAQSKERTIVNQYRRKLSMLINV